MYPLFLVLCADPVVPATPFWLDSFGLEDRDRASRLAHVYAEQVYGKKLNQLTSMQLESVQAIVRQHLAR